MLFTAGDDKGWTASVQFGLLLLTELTETQLVELLSLERGRFLRREDDTHARIQLVSGPVVVARCPSEKCFQSQYAPGQTVELSRSQENGSERQWNVERMWMDKSWIGLNARATARLITESIAAQQIDGLKGYSDYQTKAVYQCEETGETTVDVRFTAERLPDLYLDVRNVTRLDEETVRYPDYPQQENINRLDGFESMVDAGARVIVFYAVNRVQGEWFEAGYDIDPEYCERLEQAQANGVELLVARVRHTPSGISLSEVSTPDLTTE